MASSSTTTTTMTPSNSPCAACKFLRRKCQPECVFAPYFPPDQPQKFANVHKVFGASNVTKLLNELHPHQREDAVNSLAYEADMRLRDPVYGCVGVISLLQHQLRQLQMDLTYAKSELSKYQNNNLAGSLSTTSTHGLLAAAAVALNNNNNNLLQADMCLNLIGGGSNSRDHLYHHHHQFFPSNSSQHQHEQQHLIRNFDAVAAGAGGGSNSLVYDTGLLAMNVSTTGSIGQLSQQFHQQPRAAHAAGDDRRTPIHHPS